MRDPSVIHLARERRLARLRRRGTKSMLPCMTLATLSCLWAISPLTAICSLFPPGGSRLRLAANIMGSDGGTIPTWNFPGFYSLEVDFAEREEWFGQNTSQTLAFPRLHSQFNAQKPKASVRWQPLDPKDIGAVTLRGSYTEAFHAPTLGELTPAGEETFSGVHDPKGLTPDPQVQEIITGNPFLQPEVAYEWTYGAVYSPKWIKGLTLNADFWHIDLRSISSLIGAQFILDRENQFPGLVTRDPTTGAIKRIIDPNLNLSEAILEGIDYEAIYILDSAIFGGPDWGRLTFTLNGTWLSRFVLQLSSDFKPINIAGQFVPGGSASV